MAHLTLHLRIPDTANNGDPASNEKEFLSAAVAKWYELGLISQGSGAEILKLSRHDFLHILGRYGVAAIQGDDETLEHEFSNL